MDRTSLSRWPREVIVFADNGYEIRFQNSLFSAPVQPETTSSEKDLSDIVAEFEAKFAIQYPHVFKSPKSAPTSPRQNFSSLKSPRQAIDSNSSQCSITPRVKRVLTMEEKNMKRIAALQKLEDLKLEQCTFR
jgi:hypothetical protein